MSPIPRAHLVFYGALQRLVRSGRYPDAIRDAFDRAVRAAREHAPAEVDLAGGLRVDLRGLPQALRQEAGLAAALQAGDAVAAQRAIFGRPLGEDVLRQIREGRLADALEGIREEQYFADALAATADPLRGVATRAAAIALEELPGSARVVSRAAVHLRAAAYASRQAGALVTAVDRESRAAVRELATQAIREQRDIYRAARTLRQVIGLNAQQAAALDKFIAAAMEDDAYKSAAGVQQAINREYQRLLRYRSDLMARTELWQAGQEGQRQAWQEAVEEGALDIRGIGREFISKTGERSLGPLIHPFCFCSTRLRAVTSGGERYYVQEWVVSVRAPCPRCLAFRGARAVP